MKRYMRALVLCTICCLMTISCKKDIEGFLDKAPGVDLDETVIFSSKAQLEIFIGSVYRTGMHTILTTENLTAARNFTTNSTATDEGEADATFVHTQQWNAGTIDNIGTGQEDHRFALRWIALRYAYIILERIKDVPGLDDAYRNQVIGEMKFMVAHNYFEMLKRYGGVPILDKRLELGEELKIPRNSFQETVEYIAKNCTEAVTLLPATYTSNFRGRVTKTAAQMLKARTLLYAASPLYNAAQPVLSMTNSADNKLICYGNVDNNRWQAAADAAKAAIDMSAAGNFLLVTDKGVDQNYRFVWEQNDNTEIVLAGKFWGNRTRTQFPFYGMVPVAVVNSWCGVSVIHNFVRKYEKKDGTPQTWDAAGGDDLNQKYAQLDNRFAQTVAYNGSNWGEIIPILATNTGGAQAAGCFGGAWQRKFLPDQLFKSTNPGVIPNDILFRVAESYLNYAEALNEAQGPVAAAYDAVNTVRARSGQPNLPAGLTKDQFRTRIQNERDIELAFEDHRFWDIRRWKIAENEGVMKGAMYGIKINKVGATSNFSYLPYIFETRTFLPRMYYHPFTQNEVFKGYLVQNPGY
jgi:starch-binding outer membrane protein, SusD/RagB family